MTDMSEMLDIASEDPEALREGYAERGWGDGLPLVAPTPERVDAMLAGSRGDPDEPIATLPPRSGWPPGGSSPSTRCWPAAAPSICRF